ncbi:hypothetical protein [Xanthomonas bundabergensis]|uniref:hypothetical protein n=1 Tax=Xanthomonas bundabergensis TaxID=3160842 RepID=UPI003518E0B5
MHSRNRTSPGTGLRPRATRLPRLALLALAALAGGANAQQDSLQIASRTTYAAGTPEWRQLRDWLTQHASAIDGKRLGDPGQLGAVTLAYSATKPVTTGTVPRPLPLPATGTPGDSIGISSCAQGYTQSWNYIADDSQGNRWTLQSYSLKQTEPCPGGASQG